MTCTSSHHYRQYNINYNRVMQHRSWIVLMSYLERPSIDQHVDRISQLMLDSLMSRILLEHKCNYPRRPNDNSVVLCSSLGNCSKRQLMCRISQSCLSMKRHHSHRLHKSNRQTNKCPCMTVSFPSVLYIAKYLSSDYKIRLLIDPLHHRI